MSGLSVLEAVPSTMKVPVARVANSFALDTAGGRNLGKEAVHKFGDNEDIGTSEEDIWDGGGTYTFPTTAETVRVKSGGNAADTAAGAGARTVTVVGLDENWDVASETLTLAGASASAATAATFVRVISARVATVGTYGAANTGAITIENTTATQVLAVIPAGAGEASMAFYAVPRNKTAYLSRCRFVVDSNKTAVVKLWQRRNADAFSGTMSAKRLVSSLGGFTGPAALDFESFIVFPEKTDVWISGTASASETEISASMDLIVVDDDV